jgi:hypothetical protein
VIGKACGLWPLTDSDCLKPNTAPEFCDSCRSKTLILFDGMEFSDLCVRDRILIQTKIRAKLNSRARSVG